MGITGDAILGAATSIGGSIINSISANKMQQRQFEQQKQLYQQQFADQQAMIQQMNEYNSPKAQVERLKEAGLNPNLMYSNGADTGLQSEVANPQVPDAPLMQGTGSIIAGGVQKGLDTAMSIAQLHVLEAQARKMNSEATGQDIENRYTPLQFEQQLKKGQVDIQYTMHMIDKTIQDMAESNSRIRLNSTQIDSLTQGIAESKMRAYKGFLEAKGVEANTELVKQKIATEILEQGLFAFREALMSAQTSESYANTANIKSRTFEQDWKNAFIQSTGFTPDSNQWSLITQWCGNAATKISSGLQSIGKGFVDRLNKHKELIGTK